LYCQESLLTNAAAAAAGSERSYTTWREADLEWLGVKPDSVQTSVFEMGRESPNAQHHNTLEVGANL
jgi:hypothetical protein